MCPLCYWRGVYIYVQHPARSHAAEHREHTLLFKSLAGDFRYGSHMVLCSINTKHPVFMSSFTVWKIHSHASILYLNDVCLCVWRAIQHPTTRVHYVLGAQNTPLLLLRCYNFEVLACTLASVCPLHHITDECARASQRYLRPRGKWIRIAPEFIYASRPGCTLCVHAVSSLLYIIMRIAVHENRIWLNWFAHWVNTPFPPKPPCLQQHPARICRKALCLAFWLFSHQDAWATEVDQSMDNVLSARQTNGLWVVGTHKVPTTKTTNVRAGCWCEVINFGVTNDMR